MCEISPRCPAFPFPASLLTARVPEKRTGENSDHEEPSLLCDPCALGGCWCVMLSRMKSILARRLFASVGLAALMSAIALAQAPHPPAGVKYAQISPADMKEWLSYLASDELQGRQMFTEGYGLAASYVADHLKTWSVKPIGDEGTYFPNVKLK